MGRVRAVHLTRALLFLPGFLCPIRRHFFFTKTISSVLEFKLATKQFERINGKFYTLKAKAEFFKQALFFVIIFTYRTRAIITRGLYLFYLIFHCGLYSREVYIAERLVLQGNFSEP